MITGLFIQSCSKFDHFIKFLIWYSRIFFRRSRIPPLYPAVQAAALSDSSHSASSIFTWKVPLFQIPFMLFCTDIVVTIPAFFSPIYLPLSGGPSQNQKFYHNDLQMYSVFLKDPGQASVPYYLIPFIKSLFPFIFYLDQNMFPVPIFFSAPDPVPGSVFPAPDHFIFLPFSRLQFCEQYFLHLCIFLCTYHQIAACEDQILGFIQLFTKFILHKCKLLKSHLLSFILHFF